MLVLVGVGQCVGGVLIGGFVGGGAIIRRQRPDVVGSATVYVPLCHVADNVMEQRQWVSGSRSHIRAID